MEQQEVKPRRRVRSVLAAGVIAGAIASVALLAANFTATAQTATPSPSTPTLPGGGGPEFHKGGPGGPHGFGMGIHGEFVTPAQNGGYQTMASQAGEVTSVSHSSITVKSEDGYSKTYSVDDNTMVNAGNDGIDDVKNGDSVHVLALVVDGKYEAVEVMDRTQGEALHQRWAPGPPPQGASSASGSNASA